MEDAATVTPGRGPASPVLVTGANGYIATHLCRALMNAGCEVRGHILRGTDAGKLDALGIPWHEGDIRDPDTLKACMQGIRTVFHLAALALDWAPRATFMSVNADGTNNVLEAAAAAGVQRFVHMSSVAIHDFSGHVDADESTPAINHINGYCTSKIVAEDHVHRYQAADRIETTIIRPGTFVVGPGDTTVLVKMVPYLERKRLVLVSGGRQLTCYSYVENLAAGMVLAAAHPAGAGETFVLTDDARITVRELMTGICEALGYPPEFGSVPAPLARAGGWVLEMLWRLFRRRNPPPAHRYRVGIAARDSHFSCERAKRLIGYRPEIPLDEGLRRMAAWYHAWRAETGG